MSRSGNEPVVGVLALQGDVREHLAVLAECGVLARPVRRREELDSVDALVIPGGESTTISRLAVTFELLEPIRARIAGGMPAYGSCAGMILLASHILDGRSDQQSFGGIDMTVRRNAFGRQVDSFEAEVWFEGLALAGGPEGSGVSLDAAGDSRGAEGDFRGAEGGFRGSASDSRDPGRVHAVFIRAPWVESVGEGAEVLARVVGGPADGRVVAVRQGNVLATSFHPELTGDLRIHELFTEMVRNACGAAASVNEED